MAGNSGGVWEVELQRQLEAQRMEFQRVVDEANATIKRLRTVIEDEREAHAAADRELENLKKGSIAMMKYVTNLQRKKHDEELDSLKEILRAAQRPAAPRGGKGAKGGVTAPSEQREAELDAREREINEQFARLKEERELRRQEADSKFSFEMSQLPEMQKVIGEKDEKLRSMADALAASEDENRRLRRYEQLATARFGNSPTASEVRALIQGWEDEIARLREQLAFVKEEMEEVKRDFQVKMRNTIALQRIANEKELERARERPAAPRPRLGLRRK